MKILVLDGDQNQAVASVRSLARAGHTVIAGEAASWSKAGWSRSSSGTLRYPSPRKSTEQFVDAIARFARQNPGTLVMPMTEATSLPLSAHRESLISAGARFVFPDQKDLLRAFDKNQTTSLAASLGLLVPRTVTITSLEQLREATRALQYPLVLKPCASEEVSRDGKIRKGGRPRYAANPLQCEQVLQDISSRSSAVLVQEFVEGEGTGYFALMRHGELRAEFAHRRIRDVHPTGSGSAVRESVDVDPEIRRCSLALLSALHWHGVAMVEYRRKPGGPPIFMEVNGRFWHSLPLACYAGVDFPALLARMAEEGDIEPQAGYRRGVRCRWFLGDVGHLVRVWRGAPAGYPGSFPRRLRTLWQVLTPVPGTYHDLFQWRDPLPELGDWLNVPLRAFGEQ
ncbi:MAG TPA: ATP-grasp domain-containing protein [Candidatus Sulfotelmatobacter sp.]|nr:ATP-grasp domain-containing protein [Candidatus Sulfotelmatobacter sp.]